MANITLGDNDGHKLPSAMESRRQMLEDLPRAERLIPDDVREALLGEDA